MFVGSNNWLIPSVRLCLCKEKKEEEIDRIREEQTN